MNSDDLIENDICSIPWLHTEVYLQNNSVIPCCKWKGPSLGSPKDFVKIWSGSDYSKLRTDLLNKTNRTECSACDVGPNDFSYKKFKNSAYKNLKQDLTSSGLPRVVHITLKNVCNLACRMCSPSSSSRLQDLSKKSIFLQNFYRTNVDNKFDINSIAGMFGNLHKLVITGGEPLIDEDCIMLLSMAEQESTKFQSLTMSSNLNFIHPKIFEALSNTRASININVSIDGPIKIHEYIRYGCDWKNIVENLKKIKNLCSSIGVNATISAMNVGYLHELIEDVYKLETETGINFTHIMPSPVLEPHLHAGGLPDNIKQLYKEKLLRLDQNYKLRGANILIQTGLSLLESKVHSDISAMHFLQEFDKVANTDYREVYPEWI
jgi:sulfatase maturation enzyme AslB (radical SAM superfamily)